MSSQTNEVKNGIEAGSHGLFPAISNIWLTVGIIGSVGILVLLVIILIKWSNSEGHKKVDRRISEMLAGSLSNKLGVTEIDIVSVLSGAGRSELMPKLREIVDSVNVTATKTKIGQPVEMRVVLNYKDGTSYSTRSNIMWEELPGETREALIRSESNTIRCPWALPS